MSLLPCVPLVPATLMILCLFACATAAADPQALLDEAFPDGASALQRWEYRAEGPARIEVLPLTAAEAAPHTHEVYVDFRERASWSLLSRQEFTLEGGGQYTVSARVRCNLGYGSFNLVAQTTEATPTTLATVPILKRANELHTVTAVFRAPASGARVRVGIIASGYSELRILGINLSRNVPPLSSYQTGLLLPSTPPAQARYRTGAFFEAQHMLPEGAPVTEDDRDDDGLWAICQIDPDNNPWLFAENTVLKSDSRSAEEGGTLPPLQLTAHGLLPGLYQAFASDPKRDAAFSLDARDWLRAVGGAGEVALGVVRVTGPLTVWVDHRYLTADNPGPVYVDYLRLMPVYEVDGGLERPTPPPPYLERAEITQTQLCLLNGAGVPRHQEWVTAGLPFARGAFHVTDGLELPGTSALTAVPLVTWPDGSVKWLRVCFRADVPAETPTPLRLRYGPAVPAAATPPPPPQRTAAGYTLRAGALEVHVQDGVWDGIVLRGQTLVDRAPAVRLATDSGLQLTQLLVDSATPEHAATPGLLITGRLGHDGVAGPFRFFARLCERAPETLGITFGVTNEADEVFQPERGCGPAVPLTELTLVIGGVQVSPASLEWPSGAVPFVTSDQTLLQTGAGRSVAEFLGAWSLRAGQQTLAEGERTEGWVDLRQPGRGLAVGVREFVERYPGALSVRRQGDETEVEVSLWPRHEGGILRWAQGTQLVTEMALFAHDGSAPATRRQACLAAVLHPVRAVLPAEHYCQTGVFGPLSTHREQRLAPYLDSRDAFFQDLLVHRRAYGREDWGDFFDNNGYVRGSGRLWTNMEWEFPAYLIHQFACTGDADYLEAAEQAARHFASIDIIHHSSRPAWQGGSYVHTGDLREGHQVDPPDFAHAGWTQGLLWVHYLCGDELLVEAANGLADYVVRNMPPQGPYQTQPAFSMWNCSRQAGNPILTLASVWDLTRRPEHLAALDRLVDFALRVQDPRLGCWSTPFYEEPVHHRPSPDYSGILFRGLYTYWQLTGDARVARAFNRLEDFLLGRHPLETRRYLRPESYYRQTIVNVGVPCALSATFSSDPGPLIELGLKELERGFPAGEVKAVGVRSAPGVFSSGAHLIGAHAAHAEPEQ
jgi:hypothetical protein